MLKNKKILKGLNQDEYEHPFDKKALDTLESTPGLNVIGSFITKHTIERVCMVQYTGSYLKITKDNYPKIYEYLDYAAQILDLERKPELYMQWGYNINAFTIGSENPIIVLNSGLVDLCTEDEILFIIGHECGHIKSNHMLYHMMASMINKIIDLIPGGDFVAFPLQYALYYWNRMSEFTADRAGLLCCQNPQAAVTAFMKMAGTPISEFNNLHTETFLEQARNFKGLDEKNINKVIKIISIAEASHPWIVMRASELLKWQDEGLYDALLKRGRTPLAIGPTSVSPQSKMIIGNKQ
ncbi:MAG: M48 family metallopeptidase [Bacteroidales bacterium]|nr:M48 family metallopeptidase [Bacteroidales bacterium]